MKPSERILDFVRRSRRYLNRNVRLKGLHLAVSVFAGVSVLVALAFVLRGHRMPGKWLLLPIACAVLTFILNFLLNRFCDTRAVRYVDRLFGLNDGLITSHSLIRDNKCGGIHALQVAHTHEQLADADLRRLRPSFGGWHLGATVLLLLLAVWLLTFEESQAVVDARRDSAESRLISERSKRDLEKELDALEEDMDEEEKELLKKHRIKELIKKVKATENRKEAMRELAALEKELRRVADRLSTRNDERFLSNMSKEMKCAKETKKLAKALKEKDYKKAAKELRKMKVEFKGNSNKAEKMKALSKLNRNLRRATKDPKTADSSMKADASELSKSIEQLEKIHKSACKQGSKCDKKTAGERMKAGQKCNSKLGKMSDKMSRLGARRSFLAGLKKLRQKCGSCQSMMLGQVGSNGKKAGTGTDENKREGESSPSNGNLTKITGIKGEGKSRAWVEDAQSGSGVSQVRTVERKVDFKRQVEALIHREDVPEEMKEGVKTYFDLLHETETE